MYVRCGTRNRLRLIHVHKLAAVLGRDVSIALPGLHAFTGCDTVSAISGQGKLKGLKLMRQHEKFLQVFKELGQQWELTQHSHEVLEEFVCKLYACRSDTAAVNEMRYKLWVAKKGCVESGQLPPCADCLYQHCLRANYQAAVWRQCLEGNPELPSPCDHGWAIDSSSELKIKWMTGLPAPETLLAFISCKCARSCEVDKCPCWINGLKCTSECKLQSCMNMTEEDDKVATDSDCSSDSEASDTD